MHLLDELLDANLVPRMASRSPDKLGQHLIHHLDALRHIPTRRAQLPAFPCPRHDAHLPQPALVLGGQETQSLLHELAELRPLRRKDGPGGRTRRRRPLLDEEKVDAGQRLVEGEDGGQLRLQAAAALVGRLGRHDGADARKKGAPPPSAAPEAHSAAGVLCIAGLGLQCTTKSDGMLGADTGEMQGEDGERGRGTGVHDRVNGPCPHQRAARPA